MTETPFMALKMEWVMWQGMWPLGAYRGPRLTASKEMGTSFDIAKN